jgi:hypothetical protein
VLIAEYPSLTVEEVLEKLNRNKRRFEDEQAQENKPSEIKEIIIPPVASVGNDVQIPIQTSMQQAMPSQAPMAAQQGMNPMGIMPGMPVNPMAAMQLFTQAFQNPMMVAS